MLGWLISKITGSAFDRVADLIRANVDNETARQGLVAKAVEVQILADVEMRRAAMQSRVFWFVWAVFALPLGIWFAAVCLDSVFLFSGRIADLPASVKPYANQIVAAVFGTGGGVAGLQAIAGAIRGRR
jgi:hypothetical protein